MDFEKITSGLALGPLRDVPGMVGAALGCRILGWTLFLPSGIRHWQVLDSDQVSAASQAPAGHPCGPTSGALCWYLAEPASPPPWLPGLSQVLAIRLERDLLAEQSAQHLEALQEAQSIMDSIKVGVIVAVERCIRSVNQRCIDTFGFSREELIGASSQIYFESAEEYERVGQEAYPELVAGRAYFNVLRFRHKDQRPIWCRVSGNAIDPHNLSRGTIWTFDDITELKVIEAEREALLKALPLGVILARDRRVQWGNAQVFSMLGYQQTELVGALSLTYYANGDDFERIGRIAYELMQQGQTYVGEVELKRKDGSLFWAMIMGNAVDPLALDKGTMWSIMDISDRRQAEQEVRNALHDLHAAQEQLVESEKMAALGGLVAGVAHEINTPIGIAFTGITHFAQKTRQILEVFHNGQIKKSQMEAFFQLSDEMGQQIINNLSRAADLIQSFKRVAVDQTHDDQRQFDLATYLHEIALSLGPTLRQYGLVVNVDCPPNIPMNTWPGALAQVVSNLAMNASIHAYDGKPGQLKIVAEQDDDTVTLAFIDQGKGIPVEILGRIFEPFFTTRRNEGGSGLGLNIVYNLVNQRLQGRIKAESTPGIGTTIKVTLPCMLQPIH